MQAYRRMVTGIAALLLAGTPGTQPVTAQETPAAPPELPAESELVRVENHEQDRVLEYVIGPFELPADMGHYRAPVQMAPLPIDGWLHGFEFEMRDAAGDPLPPELLHHVNFIDPDHRELFAPIARRVLAAGRETHRQEMPGLIGYPVSSDHRVLVSSMFSNPTDEDYPEAYLHVRLFYSREDDGFLQPRDVYPFYLDVMGPVGPKDFAVPPGRTVKSWEGSPAIGGRILGIGGHLHDYATSLRLDDVTSGETVWEAEPEVEEETGRVVGVPTGKLWWRGGVRVHPDHRYRIVVEYDNPTAAPAPDGGMGAIGGVLWASKEVEWPEFDRSDPAYVTDLVNTLEAPEKLKGHGDHGGHMHEAAAGDADAHAGHRQAGG